MALAAGKKLGPYEILAPLGAGGMGEVYRARDPQLGREVAIKILPSSWSADPERLRRFEQEARAAAALNHPNILAVYQLGTHEGTVYLVSELLEGSTLREQLLRGPLASRKAVDYAAQIAHGLAAAHEKGIVHRDLKPENLFLTKDGRIKILDFGLAKLTQPSGTSGPELPTMGEGTQPGIVLGTVGYMSPEQVRGQATDHRTDLFALGAILYEMLTGKRAFHKPTSAETMSAILNEEPAPASQIAVAIPPALQKVVQRCLEKSPEQRFHSASDLAFALEALSDMASAQTGAVAIERRRMSGLWIGIAASTLAAAIALTMWMSRPAAVPVVESVVQLTSDGAAKGGSVETDGARIYFNEGSQGSFRIAQISTHGGQTSELRTNLSNPEIIGLSADGSELLVSIGSPNLPTRSSLWKLPVPAGQARRIGQDNIAGAALVPDGRVVYAVDKAVFITEKDGSNPRQLQQLSKLDLQPGFFSDGKQAVFIATDASKTWAIYESSLERETAHQLLKGGAGLPAEVCCPQWSADGKYLIFSGQTDGRWDLWALSREKHLWSAKPAPIRVTNGPVSYSSFNVSRDGKQIFAIGAQSRGELVRYDARVHDFMPLLGGISGYDPTFSRDGKWVAYLAYPEHTLWRCRSDGSDRLELTYPPQLVLFSRISPDGSQIAFSLAGASGIYVIGVNGGTPRKINIAEEGLGVIADWSPDGKLLVVSTSAEKAGAGLPFEAGTVEVSSGIVSRLPNSAGLIGPWFASQDTLIAVSEDQSRLILYDLKTQKQSDLASAPDKFVNWEPSPDFKYFLYQTGGNDPKIFRMRLADHQIEELADLKNFPDVDDPVLHTGTQLSVSPDYSPILTRNIGTQEIYALSVKWP
ncbi:MAG TPA: protein kinase [Candidatus Sulfotelmatobacter sp.]|nr:protein kinase [Candidatus Sulfotelmatobacter sp.]